MKKLFAGFGLVSYLAIAFANLALAQNVTASRTLAAASPGSTSPATQNAADLDLEELVNMDVKVTSASKKEESSFGAPAAIHVITGEDIQRGGFTTLPDALRTVPGLYVVQTDSHTWQVSARGFSDESNNKMLVLMDGRSVYTPVYGGVRWDVLDMPLEDIDRVEVILGPGARCGARTP